MLAPNPRLQRNRSAPLRSPLSRKPFGQSLNGFRATLTLRLACVILAVLASPRRSTAVERPAPDGCHWQKIPEVKVTLAIPDGWQFRKLPGEKNVLVFEVRPSGPKALRDSKSRYELRIQRRLPPESVVSEARAFVDGFLKNAVEATPLEEQKQGVMSMFAGVAHLGPTLFGVAQHTIAASSLANSRTGTLYTIRIEIPAEELDAVMPYANAIFRIITVDDEI